MLVRVELPSNYLVSLDVKDANFQSDEPCSLLAQLIDTAPFLSDLNISDQTGLFRKIEVSITYAEEADGVIKQGSIKIMKRLGDKRD